MDLNELKPSDRNPRNITPDALAKLVASIKRDPEFMVLRPIVVDADGVILGGNQRYRAIRKIGMKEIPDNWVARAADLTEEQKRRFILVDNAPDGMAGDWDIDILANEWDVPELEELGFDIEALLGLRSGADAAKDEQVDGEQHQKLQAFDGIDELKPTDEEYAALKDRKLICEFSGGKDSTLAAVWTKYFFPGNESELIFYDSGADYTGFHCHLQRASEWLEMPLKVLRTQRNLFDLILETGKWPYPVGPYCQKMIFETLDKHLFAHDPDKIAVIRGGSLSQKNQRGNLEKRSRFMTVDRIKQFMFFQPIYFVKADSTMSLLNASGVPMWDGYSYGLQRTACRICPGQNQIGYAAIRANYPDVWDELLEFERRLGPGAWSDPENNSCSGSFADLADRGQKRFEKGGYQSRLSAL